MCEPVTKREQYLGEHSISDATAGVCLEFTLRTCAGNRFTAGRRCDTDGGGDSGDLVPKVRGPSPTSFAVLLTLAMDKRPLLSETNLRRHHQERVGTTLDALQEAGQVWGSAADPGPPTGKERSGSLNGSGKKRFICAQLVVFSLTQGAK